MINKAYVSTALFHKLYQQDEGGSDPMAYLRLDSPSSTDTKEEVGTPLHLIPITNDDEDASVDEMQTTTIYLHPILSPILISLKLAGCSEVITEGSSDNEIDANIVVPSSVHQVQVSTYDGSNHDGIAGWLEHIDMKKVANHISDDSHAIIYLTYICSNTSRGRLFFSSREHTNIKEHDRKHGLDLLMDALTNELVVEGGILGIDIKNNHDGNLYPEGDNEEEVAFFIVNKISVNDGSSNQNVKHLHILQNLSFEIVLDPPNESGRSDETTRTKLTQKHISKDTQDQTYCCPGYEHVLEELLTLARMDNINGAPTAVILTGCAGVGKSRMASWFEEMLESKLGSYDTTSSAIVSAKDILLEEASSSFNATKILNQASPLHKRSNTTSLPERLLIIDDLDAIIGNTDGTDSSSATINSSLEPEQLRALNSIVKLIDGAINHDERYFVLGITRASWAQLPVQLARVGRFEKTVTMPSPTLGQRSEMFKYWLSTLPLTDDKTDKDSIVHQWANLLAPRTAGCVASDIRMICSDALTSANTRSSQTIDNDGMVSELHMKVQWEDAKEAARTCIPSQLSSMDVIPATSSAGYLGSGQQPDLKQEFQSAWKNFAGYDDVKARLYRTVVRPWKYHILETTSVEKSNNESTQSSVESTLGMISKPSGVLFHGPAGCGKSVAAMCLASSLGLHCVKVRASEVFNQWLGGSEATLRSIFTRARAASPCILFFDELDSLASNREGGDSDATLGVQSRILTTLLNEMDGITNTGGQQNVLVVAATNRLDAIDAALLRPGRLEEHVLLSYPKSTCIEDILKLQTAKMPVDESVDLAELSKKLDASKSSCAEIEGICRDACLIAMRRCSEEGLLENLSVLSSDFDQAFHRIKRSAVPL